jgi:CheY-like chemotaxis protein/GAF domain-containing protein
MPDDKARSCSRSAGLTPTLRALADRSYQARSAEEACEIAAAELARNANDLPFALLYLSSADGGRAHLCGHSGLGAATAANPSVVDIDSPGRPWPFEDVMSTGKPTVVAGLGKKLGSLPSGPWPEPTEQALVLPLIKPGQQKVAGFLVAGISPRLALDDSYRGFLDLVAAQAATAVASARAYQEERQRAEALAELDRAKTAFFSNVSHEFRTPLTLMLGPLEDVLAADGEVPPRIRDQVTIAHRNALRLLKLVNTLLDFSRIESGRVESSYEPVDLVQLTAELASNFRSAIERAGMRLVIDCVPLAEPVWVDREMWEKIVLNLLSNAFKFSFEAVSVSPAGDGHVQVEAHGEAGSGYILFADDNADMRDYVRRLLAGRYEVDTVADGQSALRLARERKPDLLLSDIMMPGLDGMALLRALRADPRTREVPILLLSARAGEESRVEGLDAGADDYLVKPFTARELLARVKAHLGRAQERRRAADALNARLADLEKANAEVRDSRHGRPRQQW